MVSRSPTRLRFTSGGTVTGAAEVKRWSGWRAVIAYDPAREAEVRKVCADNGVSLLSLGLTGGERLTLLAGGPLLDVAVADLRARWADTFPAWAG